MDIKNTIEESGKCKTVILIDGSIIFTSDAYTWKHPVHPMNSRKECEVNVGPYYGTKPKFAIRNISIKAYE